MQRDAMQCSAMQRDAMQCRATFATLLDQQQDQCQEQKQRHAALFRVCLLHPWLSLPLHASSDPKPRPTTICCSGEFPEKHLLKPLLA
jgi:hypothetical protein